MAKTRITLTATPAGYLMDYRGRFGGGGSMHVGKTPEEAAGKLAWGISRYIETNPEGGDYTAPKEVTEAMAASTAVVAPDKGARLSYYASPSALAAIQSEREATGASQSGAINALVLRGAEEKESS